MTRLLMHESLAVRIRATIALTFGLLISIWFFSALLLPPGIIRFNAGTWLEDLPVLPSALFIFAINLLIGACGVILMNQWHTRRGLAAGYYLLLLRSSVFHGILRGTNSFAFPYTSHVENIIGFLRVGLWETLALCLICAATASLARYPTSSYYGLVSFYKFIHNPTAYIKKRVVALSKEGVFFICLGMG